MIGDRRDFLKAAAAIAPATTFSPHLDAATAAPLPRSSRDDAVRTPDLVARTRDGPVRGYWSSGVHVFKGIPYAGAPTGAYRFARAPALAPWTEVRGAYSYGPICPQSRPPADEAANEWPFLLPRGQPSAQLEDCLRANVWTPGLADGRRRPVMVWIHPQGFMSGSSQDFLATDGENLARQEDVVVVSVNHRVGPLGFMHLGRIAGQDFADSGNVGMLDLVDALRWVRHNAAAFGGDPGNVTLFGQSGGGFKISVLMAMPEAKGLFHKAIIHSGARLRVHGEESASKLASATLEELGIAERDAVGLRDIAVDKLLAAVDRATLKVMKAAARPDPANFLDAPSFYWMPVAGVPSLPTQPWDPDAPAQSRDIPLLIGSTTHEAAPAVNDPAVARIGWDELAGRVRPVLADRADAAIGALRRAWPAAAPADILAMILGRNFRLGAVQICRRRAAMAAAALTFNYLFAWRTEAFEGRPGAFHSAELPFVFANSELVPQISGGGSRGRSFAVRMAGLWASFARTGRPRAAGVPDWPPVGAGQIPTMWLDDQCRLLRDPDADFLRVFGA